MTSSSFIPPPSSLAGKLRLPAYSNSLLSLRMGGVHPLYATLVYSKDWALAKDYAEKARAAHAQKIAAFSPAWVTTAGWPVVALSPRDYAPGCFDFRVFTAMSVTVQDLDLGWHELEGPQGRRTKTGALYFLLGDLAQWAGQVYVAAPDLNMEHSAGLFALCERSYSAETRRHAWPAWWSQQIEEEHGKRSQQWFAELARHHQQHSARAA
jgi:hypothetical protein